MRRGFKRTPSHRQISGHCQLRQLLAMAAVCLTLLGVVPAQAAALPSENDLVQLSLEDLMTLEVASASRKAQSLADTAAAVFVITNEDIRRSGVPNT